MEDEVKKRADAGKPRGPYKKGGGGKRPGQGRPAKSGKRRTFLLSDEVLKILVKKPNQTKFIEDAIIQYENIRNISFIKFINDGDILFNVQDVSDFLAKKGIKDFAGKTKNILKNEYESYVKFKQVTLTTPSDNKLYFDSGITTFDTEHDIRSPLGILSAIEKGLLMVEI